MELTRPIEITITGTQFFSATDLFFSEPEEITEEFSLASPAHRRVELCTGGELSWDQDAISVSYEESDITGLEGSRTTFTLSDGVVSLSRAGSAKSHLVFEHGKRYQLFGHEGAYPVFVKCHSLSHDLTPAGGKIDIDYSVEVCGSTVEHNAYTIRVNV